MTAKRVAHPAASAKSLISLPRLRHFSPQGKVAFLEPVVSNIAIMDKHSINTPLRVAHFLGRCAVETAYFKTLFERHNPSRWKGRGYIQLTGPKNYTHYGKITHTPLTTDPDRAAEPDLAMLLACLFWSENKLNNFADQDDARRVSRAINRGSANSRKPANNERERLEQTARAKDIFKPQGDESLFSAESLFAQLRVPGTLEEFAELRGFDLADASALQTALSRTSSYLEEPEFVEAIEPTVASGISPAAVQGSLVELFRSIKEETEKDTRWDISVDRNRMAMAPSSNRSRFFEKVE